MKKASLAMEILRKEKSRTIFWMAVSLVALFVLAIRHFAGKRGGAA